MRFYGKIQGRFIGEILRGGGGCGAGSRGGGEVKMMILGFGADVAVEEPAALRREVLEEIGRMAGVYGSKD